MPARYDVTLGGYGFMVKPGSYQRFQDGAGESRVGRVRLFDFYGGARRAAQLERDRFWHGVGAWPALDSQGVVAGPRRTDVVETVSPGSQPQARRWSFAWSGATYVVEGAYLYRVTRNPATGLYTGLAHVHTFAAPVTDATLIGDVIFAGLGAGAPAVGYDLSVGAAIAPIGTAKAQLVGNQGGRYVWVQPVSGTAQVYGQGASGPISATLDTPILRLVQHDGACWALTQTSLYRFSDANYQGSSFAMAYTAEAGLPRLGHPDDLAWAVSHLGQLWCWLGKEVHLYNRSRGLLEPSGLRGRATLGATSVGRWLVVCLQDEVAGRVQLWGWDGRGWWLLDEDDGVPGALGDHAFAWPVCTFGAADDADLLAGRGATANRTAIWQFYPRPGRPGLRDTVTLTTALLDGGERDLEKAWTRLAAELAWPDERATGTTVDVALAYSIDGGATWATVASQPVPGGGPRAVQVSGAIPGAARSRWLQARVTVSGITDWCPVLVGLWAEHETLDIPVRRRRWRFTVACRDALVLRDGATDTTGARATAARLWDIWAAGGVTTFRDVDDDLTGREYTVRIAGIRETVPKVQDAATFAESEVELQLVEI